MPVVRLTPHRRLGVLVAAAAPLLWMAPPVGAGEVVVADVATWTRNPLASPPPEGGLAVANAPDGPVTISAVRFDLGGTTGGAGSITLQLEQAGGVALTDAPIVACPTSAPWESGVNGDLADAPAPQCDLGSVALQQTPEGSWSADITPLLATGDAIVLLPAEGATSPYSLTFEPPAATSDAAAPPTSGEGELSASPPSAPTAPSGSFSVTPPPAPFSPAPAPFTMEPSELAAPPPPAGITSTPASPVVAPEPTSVGASELSGAPGRARDLGQAVRIALLALASGAASIPIFRLLDGRHVPGLSPLLELARRGTRGGGAMSGTEPT